MIGNVNDTLPISNPTKAVDSVHNGIQYGYKWINYYTQNSQQEKKTAENFG